MKSITLVLFGLVPLMLSGCGSQDRYQVMEPSPYMEIQEGRFATISRVPSLHNRGTSYSTAEVDGVVYFSSGSQIVYRVTDEGYETLPIIPDLFVNHMVADPDGQLWVTDPFAQMYSFQDGQWVFEVDLNISGHLNGLLSDNQGRLFAYGDDNGLWCRESSGEWNLNILPENTSLQDGWSDFGQDPIFVDSQLRLFTEGADGWQLSDSLGEDLQLYRAEIQGNPQGWLAVPSFDDQIIFLNHGDGWQEIPYTRYVNHVFWLGDDLYATYSGSDDLLHWSGADWEPFLSFAGTNLANCFNSQSSGTGRQLFFHNGASLYFDGSSLALETPGLGDLYGLVSFENSNHLILSNGYHYRDGGGDGIWQEVGAPLADGRFVDDHNIMVIDDRDQLVFFGQYVIKVWNGNSSYQEIPVEPRLKGIYPQSDGRVVVASNYMLGLWAEGGFRWLGEHHENSSEIQSCLLEDDDGVWVVAHSHLRWVEPEQSAITLTFQGWVCNAAILAEEWGLVCSGSGHLVAVDGSKVHNLTPGWADGSDWRVTTIRSLIPDGQGRWLAFDSQKSSLLLFDGVQWWGQEDEELLWIEGWFIRPHFTDVRDGTILMQIWNMVFMVELEGGQ